MDFNRRDVHASTSQPTRSIWSGETSMPSWSQSGLEHSSGNFQMPTKKGDPCCGTHLFVEDLSAFNMINVSVTLFMDKVLQPNPLHSTSSPTHAQLPVPAPVPGQMQILEMELPLQIHRAFLLISKWVNVNSVVNSGEHLYFQENMLILETWCKYYCVVLDAIQTFKKHGNVQLEKVGMCQETQAYWRFFHLSFSEMRLTIFKTTPAVSACSHSHWIQLPMQWLDLAIQTGRWILWYGKLTLKGHPACQQSSLPCQGLFGQNEFRPLIFAILWNDMKWYEMIPTGPTGIALN